MSRRRQAIRRTILPDPRYGSEDMARFINKVMRRGKKTVAQRVVYAALDQVKAQIERDPLEVFAQAVRNATPMVQVKARRVGGATYQVPVEIQAQRQQTLAMRWLIQGAKERQGRPMADRLAQELLEAFKGQGAAVKRRENMHRMAEANRAFVHYRW